MNTPDTNETRNMTPEERTMLDEFTMRELRADTETKTPETNREMLSLQKKSLHIIAEHRGRDGDKTVEADITGAIQTITALETERDAARADLNQLRQRCAGLEKALREFLEVADNPTSDPDPASQAYCEMQLQGAIEELRTALNQPKP